MNTKEYLGSIRELSDRIKRLQETRESIRNDLYSIGGIDYEKDKVQTSVSDDRMINLIARVEEIEKDLIKEIAELTETRNTIVHQIDKVPNRRCRDLLYERYVLCKNMAHISVDWDRDIRYLYRLQRKAIWSFEKVVNDH